MTSPIACLSSSILARRALVKAQIGPGSGCCWAEGGVPCIVCCVAGAIAGVEAVGEDRILAGREGSK